ncbi:multidrug transporter [Pseudomonas baetica]|uniref:multidrug transporter n=1 Tax=Pseudomonas baetica TaxID=674054 RepID=UPI003EECBBA2
MNLFRTLVVTLLLSIGNSAVANSGSGDPLYIIQNPPAYAMIGDLLIARPLLVAATVIGAGVFVVSLPFTALGGGVGDAGQALVVDPAKAAFARCLGCIGEGVEQE